MTTDQAFPLGQRRPRREDRNHLAWLRTLPCVVTGTRPVEAAHIRFSDARYGKRDVGKQEKPDDRWAVPLCPDEHRIQHGMNERVYWTSVGIDPLVVALSLYGASGDDIAAREILRNARR